MERFEVEAVRVWSDTKEVIQAALDLRAEAEWIYINSVATDAYIYLFFMEYPDMSGGF